MYGFDFYKKVVETLPKEQISHSLEKGMNCGDLILDITPKSRTLLKQYEYPDDVVINKDAKTYTFPWAYDTRYDTWVKAGEQPDFDEREEDCYEYV